MTSQPRIRNRWQALYRKLAMVAGVVLTCVCLPAFAAGFDAWFEDFKQRADDDTLYRFLYAMPKGGDLHNHLTGAVHSEWLLDLALAAEKDGYTYYTKVRIDDCGYGTNEYAGSPYLMYFQTISHLEYAELGACEKGEFLPLDELSADQRKAWLDSLRLDRPFEGRVEFFEALWPRLGSIADNPYLVAETVYQNMRAFGAEGARYIEGQIRVHGYVTADGTPITPEAALEIFRERMSRRDAQDTGVTVRFQLALLRFTPNAEDAVRLLYRFVAQHPELVSVNLVGREDNDKGYPLRFLEVFREMRRTLPGVRLSIHAGEVDEPNQHVRDTLLLGAERIGHGVNLISDPDTLLLMRHNRFLVEINLVSNLLLEYVSDYSEHPFPEYLRTGIPVALSTDDRGMWDSTLTDEFFVAVKEFNLSWSEIRLLSKNSLSYGFMEDDVKTALLASLETDLADFERRAQRGEDKLLNAVQPQYRGFVCRRYQVCALDR